MKSPRTRPTGHWHYSLNVLEVDKEVDEEVDKEVDKEVDEEVDEKVFSLKVVMKEKYFNKLLSSPGSSHSP